MKTLCGTPRLNDHWEAETLSILHVLLVCGVILVSLFKPGGTVGYPAHPRIIPPSVRPSVRKISFKYSVENLLIPTIKATIETSWYWHRRVPSPTTINFSEKNYRPNKFGSNILKQPWLVRKNAHDQQIWSIILQNSAAPPVHAQLVFNYVESEGTVLKGDVIWHSNDFS